MSDRLELLHPKKSYPNSWRLFNRRSHRSQNRCATLKELKYVFNEWCPDGSVRCNGTIEHHINDSGLQDLWLKRALKVDESLGNKKILILHQESPKHGWYKVMIKDDYNDNFILRSFHYKQPKNYKPLYESHTKNYLVDISTIGAGESFWLKVRTLINSLKD
jgi:hypothetical protein